MSDLPQLLARLQGLGVRLGLDGKGGLRVDAPRGALSQDLVQELKDHKSQLLLALQNPEAGSVPAAGQGQAPALSFSQQRLWVLDRLEGPSPAYNMPLALEILGPLRVEALQDALLQVVRRHRVLRSVIREQEGRPVLKLLPAEGFRVGLESLAHLPPEQRRQAADQAADREASEPFDLANDYLMRARILRLGQDRHLLLCTMHHIASDGWSLGVLVREVSLFYQAATQGGQAPPAPAWQYSDYAAWQRGLDLSAQADFWLKHLRGAPDLLNLPLDHRRQGPPSPAGAQVGFSLSPALSRGLQDMARQNRATPFMLLLSAFFVLLSRYGGQTDLVAGTALAGRTRPELEPLIGFFVNTLALRADLSEAPPFNRFLGQTRDNFLAVLDHQELPFEHLVELLNPQRALEHAPLVQAMFSLDNSPARTARVAGLTMKPWPRQSIAAKFDLTLSMHHTADGGLAGAWQYRASLFEPATIERVAANFQVLLQSILADPARAVDRLEMIASAERRLLLEQWATGPKAQAPGPYLCDLVDGQARRRPSHPAVVHGQQVLSYGELKDRSDALAAWLAGQGAGPETSVAFCLEQGPLILMAIMAIWKAGAGYLPLSPLLPPARMELMLAETGARLVLCQSSLADLLPRGAAGVLLLDRDWPRIADHDLPIPSGPPSLDSLAYTIYTSGSSGTPKGVQVSHAGLASLAHTVGQYWRLDQDSRTLPVASPSFDGFLVEGVAPLCHGATVHLLDRDRLRPDGQFLDFLAESRISATTIPPALLAAMPFAPLPSLKVLMTAGEESRPATVERWQPGREMLNGYGPTEATVWCLTHRCRPGRAPVPIGRPNHNALAYVLDRHGDPLPAGATGQLCLGGPGVARGYLNRPELTAAQFRPNPHGQGRMYLSGDLARWTWDGELEYLGRADGQVQIRGYRVETGEVEAVLARHPAVRDCLVLARQPAQGDKRLIAYLACEKNARPDAEELRAHLRLSLPPYMMPSAFVFLPELPRNPNGKVDHKALPDPNQAAAPAADQPQGAVEQALARVWRETLGLASVGRQDNFFEIGGDSIISIRVVSRLAELGFKLKPRDLFQHQTIAALAAKAEKQPAAPGRPDAYPDQPGPVPLSPIQHWFLETLAPAGPHHFNQSLALELDPAIDPARLEKALAGLVSRHQALRLRFRPEGRAWRQELLGPQEAAGKGPMLASHDLSGLPASRQQERLAQEAASLQASLNLEHGPIMRAGLFFLGQGRAPVLLWIIHHLAVDAVSWRVLTRDLEKAYAGQGADQAGASVPFPHWCRVLAAWAQSEELDQQAAYWQEQARLPVSPLATDQSPPPLLFAAGARRVALQIDGRASAALLGPAHAAYGTRGDELLLAALAMAFGRFTGQEELVLDLESHGREEIQPGLDLADSVGWFTASYPARLPLNAPNPRAAIPAVKEALRAVPSGGLGYGVLRYLNRDPVLCAAAPRQVSFNYLGGFQENQGAAQKAASLIRGAAPIERGPFHGPNTPRSHLLEISGSLGPNGLRFNLQYSPEAHREESMAKLAGLFRDCLLEVARHCKTPGSGWRTPSDYPMAGLAQEQLDQVLGQLGELGQAFPQDLYPLSPAQLGMLLESLAAARAGIHLEQAVHAWPSLWDGQAFCRAWVQLARRHPALKTGFLWQGLPRPLQFVASQAGCNLREVDLSSLPFPEQQQRLEALLEVERQAGMNLAMPPLARFVAAKTGPGQWTLLQTMHHLVLDGWSGPILANELARLYQAELQGRAADLPPSRPYKDYVAWLQSRDQEKSRRFWQGLLQGYQPPRPWPPLAEARPGHGQERAVLEKDSANALNQLARANRLTPGSLVQGLWALVLAWRLARRDLVLGITVSGRPADLAGSENMVGFFSNTVPLRARLLEKQSALDFLRRLQEDSVNAREHAFATAGQIQQWAGIPAGRPLFASLVVYQNYSRPQAAPRPAAPALPTGRPIGARTSNPLTLLASPLGGLSLRAVYDQARLAPQTVRQMLKAFLSLARALAADPSMGIDDLLSLLPAPLPLPSPAQPSGAPYQHPRGPLEQQLAAIWQEVLGLDMVGVDDDFFALGGHSLAAVQLMGLVNGRFETRLPLASLFSAPTIGKMARLVCQDKPDQPWPSLVAIRPAGDLRPFWCLPGGGGHSLYLHHLAKHLGERRPFYSLQPPGLDGKSLPLESIPQLASHYLGLLKKAQPAGPYLLGGHSFGGRVALEMARQLGGRGDGVALLVVLDVLPFYQGPRDVPQYGQARWLQGLLEAALNFAGLPGGPAKADLEKMDQEQRLDFAAGQLALAGMLPPGADRQMVRGLLGVFQANAIAARAYQPGPGQALPVFLVCPETDPGETRDAKQRAWSELGQVELAIAPGNHVSMLAPPQVEELARLLKARLAKAD